MIKPKLLQKGDKIAIVSLSRGLLGMPFCQHEVEIGLQRLRDFGLDPVIMPNATKDMDYLAEHPEARAADLKQAFLDNSIKAIICAIGGNDTYKTVPFLMDDAEFREAVVNHPKIFTGFSDTTNNHLMFLKLGLETFYGPCFLVDIAELDTKMLPYTQSAFEMFLRDHNTNPSSYEIKPSPVWYDDRASYGPEEVGQPRVSHEETHGFETLHGSGKRSGKLYGGCIECIYDALVGNQNSNAPAVYQKYQILPTADEWREKILFLESSDEKPTPEQLEAMLMELKSRSILELVQGVIVGKPIDELYYDEYKKVYEKMFADLDTPVLYNVNFGHAVPRCILPYGTTATVDYDAGKITIDEPMFAD